MQNATLTPLGSRTASLGLTAWCLAIGCFAISDRSPAFADGLSIDCCTPVDFSDGGRQVTQGYYARIDLTQATIVIPSLSNSVTCTDPARGRNPLESVAPNQFGGRPTWQDEPSYQATLMINANFFDVSDGRNPYTDACTNGLGLTVSNGIVVSADSEVHDQPTETLVFFTPDYERQVGRAATIVSGAQTTYPTQIQNAVSGYRLLKDGVALEQPGAIEPHCPLPRTAAGLTRDGNTLLVIVISPGDNACAPTGGATLPGLAAYLLDLGAGDALTLDGGGSSQLYFRPPGQAPVASLPSDAWGGAPGNWPPDTKFYRPVPIFLGFR